MSGTCAITGPRPQNMFGFNESDPRYELVKQALQHEIRTLIQNNVSHFISGVALGIDMFAAETVLDLKRHYTHVTLEAAIPHRLQHQKWSTEYQNRYRNILNQCDEITTIQQDYTPNCFFRRNRYMVDNATHLLTVTQKSNPSSGTQYTIQYAAQKRLNIVLIDIDELLKGGTMDANS